MTVKLNGLRIGHLRICVPEDNAAWHLCAHIHRNVGTANCDGNGQGHHRLRALGGRCVERSETRFRTIFRGNSVGFWLTGTPLVTRVNADDGGPGRDCTADAVVIETALRCEGARRSELRDRNLPGPTAN